jgi:hypothetical protein
MEEIINKLKEAGYGLGGSRNMAAKYPDKVKVSDDTDWVSDEQKQKAIYTNECWTLQVYPHTPVGFYKMSAADLDVLLAYANKEDN